MNYNFTHKLYEKQRLPETTEEEKENLGREMDKIFNKVPVPKKKMNKYLKKGLTS